MIHIGTVMKVLGERKKFIQNHLDFLGFVLDVFGGKLEAGTVFELCVIKPGQEEGERSRVALKASDMEFLYGVQELVQEIVKE